MTKVILGIETSCDETAAAVLKKDGDHITILSNVVASSAELQAKYGGIIPEQAAREQLKSIIPVIEEALTQAFAASPKSNIQDLISKVDAIAVTQGPGLIGSLLIGAETAKVLAAVWQKPLIPVSHLIGHFYANWVSGGDESGGPPLSARKEVRISNGGSSQQDPEKHTLPKFPCLGLLVSGGHTDLVLFENHGKYKYLGGTRDDAAGECFDKCARLLGLPYPGGPQISKYAQNGNPKAYILPRPMLDSADLDFSFSGLKTAVANLVNQLTGESVNPQDKSDQPINQLTNSFLSDLCASIEQAIIDCLVKKTIQAIKITGAKQLMIAGGVASNQRLRAEFEKLITHHSLLITLHVPPPYLCTDNASMIAASAFFQEPIDNPLTLQANPNLSLAY